MLGKQSKQGRTGASLTGKATRQGHTVHEYGLGGMWVSGTHCTREVPSTDLPRDLRGENR